MASSIDANPASDVVDTVADLHERAEQRVDRHQRVVESVTASLGRPHSLYAVVVLVLFWILANSLSHRFGYRPLDPPPFYGLESVLAVLALLMTMVILITQNRHGRMAERRAQLDLQMSILAEQKVAKLIQLVEELRRDLPQVANRRDLEAEAMQEPADPHAILVALEAKLGDELEGVEELDQEEIPIAQEAPVHAAEH